MASIFLFLNPLIQVYECVIKWVGHDLEKRSKDLASLMENVRLPLLTQEYLVQHVEENSLIRSDAQCKNIVEQSSEIFHQFAIPQILGKDLLIEALKYHLLRVDQRSSYQSPRTRPRLPIGLPKVKTK